MAVAVATRCGVIGSNGSGRHRRLVVRQLPRFDSKPTTGFLASCSALTLEFPQRPSGPVASSCSGPLGPRPNREAYDGT